MPSKTVIRKERNVRQLAARLDQLPGDDARRLARFARGLSAGEAVFARQLEQAGNRMNAADGKLEAAAAETAAARQQRDRASAELREKLFATRRTLSAAGGFDDVLAVFHTAGPMPADPPRVRQLAERVCAGLLAPHDRPVELLPGVVLDPARLAASFRAPFASLTQALERLEDAHAETEVARQALQDAVDDVDRQLDVARRFFKLVEELARATDHAAGGVPAPPDDEPPPDAGDAPASAIATENSLLPPSSSAPPRPRKLPRQHLSLLRAACGLDQALKRAPSVKSKS